MNLHSPRQLGKSNLYVSPLGFGGGTIGSPFVDTETAFATVRTAWDVGVRFFDTAPWYGVGRSERRLGMALGDLEQPRESFALNTKIGKSIVPEPTRDESKKTYCADGSVRTPRDGRTGFRIAFDYSAKGFQSQLTESLQRLGLASVDTLTIHDVDFGYHNQDQLESVFYSLSSDGLGGAAYLDEVRNKGIVKAVGAGCNLESRNAFSWESSAHEDLVERLLEEVKLDFLVLAGCYTLLETRALRKVLPMCEKHGVGVIAATPFAGGWLVDHKQDASYMYGKASNTIVEKTNQIAEVCNQYNIPVPAVALQFQLNHPLVATVIPGGKHPEEVRKNQEYASMTIPEQLWTGLKDVGLLDPEASTPNK